MRKILFIIFIISLTISAYGQQYPVFNQYLLNPVIYNPAAIGNSGYTELNLTYRQQWAGIQDAPVTQALNFQFPINEKIQIGLNAYNDYAVLLNSSSVNIGIAYRVKLDRQHMIKFGLSSGVGFNSFELEKVDNPNDPALRDVLEQTTFLSGQFGVFYQYKNLNIGASLPQLYKYNAIDTSNFQKVTIDQLSNYIITMSYRINFSPVIAAEPFLQYRKSDNQTDIIEAGSMFNYKDLFSIGGSYRHQYGVVGFVGININNSINLSYAYELATSQSLSIGNGSHELNLKIRFGNKRIEKRDEIMMSTASETDISDFQNQPDDRTNIEPENVVEPTKIGPEETITVIPPEKEEQNVQSFDNSIQEEAKQSIIEDSEEVTDEIDKSKTTLAPGYYVIVGAFRDHNNVVKYIRDLKSNQLPAKYGYIANRDLYYVYSLHTQNLEEAKRLRNALIPLNDFKDTWIFRVR